MNWFIKVLREYAVFSGRARRKEFWMFNLFDFIFSLAAFLLGLAILGILGAFIFLGVYTVATIVPFLAVSVRRLHDVGKSGWYYLINLIPIAGPIWFLVLACTDSQAGDNEYGPNPKEEIIAKPDVAAAP